MFDLLARIRLVDNASSALGSITAKLGTLAAAAGATAVVFKSVNKAMDFEAQLSSIQALTGATNTEMAAMQKLALDMGAKTKYNALEAAQGIEELLKAGLSPATVQAGGLEAALNLATAGGLGLAEAAEIMSTSLNAYKADSMTAAKASDILAGTANASATGVSDLRFSLSAVSAVAAGVGMTFKDTNIALGLFANNALKGSDAGTSLKTMLMNLQPTTDDQIELFKKLGIVTKNGANQFYTAKGKLKSLEEISGTLNKALGGLTDQQRMLALETMFGSDAIRAANILYKEGAKGVKDFEQEMLKVTALDVAKKKMDNASGAVEQLSGALETMQISAMLPFMPIIKRIALGAADFSDKISPSIVSAMERASKGVSSFIDELAKDTTFKNLEWGDAFIYATDKAFDKLNGWISSSGGNQLDKAISKLAEMGASAGAVLVSGMGSTALATIKENPMMALLLGGYVGLAAPGPIQLKAILGLSVAASPHVMKLIDWLRGYKPEGSIDILTNLDQKAAEMREKGLDPSKTPIYGGGTLTGTAPEKSFSDKVSDWIDNIGLPTPGRQEAPSISSSRYHGIDYVPRDGMTFRLHQGEKVMTAQENKQGQSSKGTIIIPKLADQIIIREEADIDLLTRKLTMSLAEQY
ncbi:phage tail tape measure protein [Brevibacillus laterosporus]|uniref:Phage tail tape measure protein n=1 Tax=Brevibacillus laterosporus TaxID=1465 RepID=A0A518V9F9_BRELA|nr:phage tail tape measure protein [Brevibacillus laterosporus]